MQCDLHFRCDKIHRWRKTKSYGKTQTIIENSKPFLYCFFAFALPFSFLQSIIFLCVHVRIADDCAKQFDTQNQLLFAFRWNFMFHISIDRGVASIKLKCTANKRHSSQMKIEKHLNIIVARNWRAHALASVERSAEGREKKQTWILCFFFSLSAALLFPMSESDKRIPRNDGEFGPQRIIRTNFQWIRTYGIHMYVQYGRLVGIEYRV